ncbi:MAG: histidinol-phosphate transaminase [Deltaproteobacteria bacterium]|nr:histidinol-phosphate transaminase [Deltaproteobacteria bacterium]
MKPRVPSYIAEIKPYPPGKPLEELEREYGIKDSIKLASNENPLGPSPKAVAAITAHLARLHRYPDGSGYYLIHRLAEKLNVSPNQIVLGNGSNEIIELLIRTYLKPGDEVISPFPSFLMYDLLIRAAGCHNKVVPLKDFKNDLESMADRISSDTRMIFVNNPNNPTGTIVSRDAFERFLRQVPSDVIVAVDEAYIEFVQERDCPVGLDYIDSGKSVVALRTFSKAYGLAGLRVGYGVMSAEMAGFINRVRQPFNTNALAQAGALAALDDDEFFAKTLSLTHTGLKYLYRELDRLSVRYYTTQTNFFLIDVGMDAKAVYEKMLRQGVIVRAMTAYGYPNYIRVTVGLPEENERFIKALEKVLNET